MTDPPVNPRRVPQRHSWGESARCFARDVKEARRKRAMTTHALAEQCALSMRVIEDLERGFPVAPQAVAAVVRNLGLPLPSLEADPVYRLGLLVRQRREQARLSRTGLAELSGAAMLTIKRLERARNWPRAETCAALLSVPALQLQPEDVAYFTSEPAPAEETDSEPALSDQTQEAQPAAASTTSTSGQSSRRRSISRRSLGQSNPASNLPPRRRLAFTVRVYDDGTLIFRPGHLRQS